MNSKLIISSFTFVVLIGLVSCEKNTDGVSEITKVKYFYQSIEIENSKEVFSTGDTIWFSANINSNLTDSESKEVISLENQTYIVHGMVNLLMPKYDSIPFIYQNFDIVEDIGKIQIINVLNNDPAAYTFDIRFGRPLLTNELRFGLVLNYMGIFAAEYKAWVYYGSDRVDYNDFSLDYGKGTIDLNFSNETINDSIFNALPTEYIYYFQSYYNSSDIYSNKFYFFEVDNR